MRIKIGNRFVGGREPAFVIAEAGVNHNGDAGIARKLIRIAAAAKADAVKFQTWITEEVVTMDAPKASYQAETTGTDGSQYDLLKELELSFADFTELDRYARKQGILFLSSADDEKSADFLDDLGVPAFKAGSGILTNTPMLRHIARKDKPVILSTGMATIPEIERAVAAIRNEGNDRIVLLQCTSSYPARYEDVHLRAMQTLKDRFRTVVGLSDHTLGIAVPIAAAALGASVIEKHFTFNRNAPGVDQRASVSPAELRAMVAGIRNVEAALGSREKTPTEDERGILKVSRESVVAAADIAKNTVLTAAHLATKRPGTGIPPYQMDLLIGKRAIRRIRKDELISLGMVKPRP